jgi:hypothetical protein
VIRLAVLVKNPARLVVVFLTVVLELAISVAPSKRIVMVQSVQMVCRVILLNVILSVVLGAHLPVKIVLIPVLEALVVLENVFKLFSIENKI